MAQPKRKSPEKKTKKIVRKPPPSRAAMLLQSSAAAIARHPRLISGVTIFGVMFSIVSANALWYQPKHHPAPLLATRMFSDEEPAPAARTHTASAADDGVTTFRIEREADAANAAPTSSERPSPLIRDIQSALATRGLYDGAADGVPGPKTTSAILFFQETEGLDQTGAASADLLARLNKATKQVAVLNDEKPDAGQTASTRKSDDVAELIREMDQSGTVPVPASAYPEKAQAQPASVTASEAASVLPVKQVMMIQKALVGLAYGDIQIDGKTGAATRAAIRSFEKSYRLPVTGQPSAQVLKKLKSIGAI